MLSHDSSAAQPALVLSAAAASSRSTSAFCSCNRASQLCKRGLKGAQNCPSVCRPAAVHSHPASELSPHPLSPSSGLSQQAGAHRSHFSHEYALAAALLLATTCHRTHRRWQPAAAAALLASAAAVA